MGRSHLEGNGTECAPGLPSAGWWCQAFIAVAGTNSQTVAGVRRNNCSPRSSWACKVLVCSSEVDSFKNLNFNWFNCLAGSSIKAGIVTNPPL